MNRKIAPQYGNIEHINFVEPQIETLSNKAQIASFQTGSQEVLKIDLVFEAGTRFGNSALVPSITNLMLREGSEKYSSEQIAETLDFYGTHLGLSVDKDVAKITLYTLSKHIDQALDVLSEVVLNPTFPEDKLNILIQKQKQKHEHNLQKVKHLANQKFTEELYGKGHPYGKVVALSDFDNISREDVVNFYHQYYTLNNCKIIVSGRYNPAVLETIKQLFSVARVSKDNEPLEMNPTIEYGQTSFLIEKDDAMQSGLRLGKALFNAHHPDFQDLQVVNTILGGYFGSRLMKNIREEKGYTYGIGSGIIANKFGGYLTIVSEVNAMVSQQAIEEVRKELKLMRSELVSAEELEKVRSYMLGQILRMVDGPFELSTVFLNAWLSDKNWGYYREYIETIKNITPERIQNLSEQYFHEDSMLYVVAGK